MAEGRFRSSGVAIAYGLLLASCGLFFGLGIGTFNSFFKHFIKNYPDLSLAEVEGAEAKLNFFFVLGGAATCLAGSYIYETLGRRKAIFAMLLSEIAVMAAMFVKDLNLLFGLRFCAGFLGCFSTLVAPLMMKEVLPEAQAKRYGGFFSAFLTAGISLGYLFKDPWTFKGWRVVLMWPIVPEALKFGLFCLFKIESPKWMIYNGSEDAEIEKNYKRLYTDTDAALMTAQLRQEYNARQSTAFSYASLLNPDMRVQFFLTILLNLLNQLTGINFLILYSTAIFEKMGLWRPSLLTLFIGLFNFGGCLLLTMLTGRFSAKTIMGWGIFGQALGYCVMLGAMAFNVLALIPLGPYIYIVSFGVSLGGLLYVYCASLVPSEALSLCSLAQWFFTCLIAFYGKKLSSKYPIETIFFALQVMTTIGGLLFMGYAIDTTGKSPREVREEFERKGFFS